MDAEQNCKQFARTWHGAQMCSRWGPKGKLYAISIVSQCIKTKSNVEQEASWG